MVYPPTEIQPSTNPAVHGRESNSRPVDHIISLMPWLLHYQAILWQQSTRHWAI